MAWIDDARLMFTSDKAKVDQPYSCVNSDQSLHVVSLPGASPVRQTVQRSAKAEAARREAGVRRSPAEEAVTLHETRKDDARHRLTVGL